ncbi:hypothetical protein W909_13050 [Dickeya zeae EC1]|nr:hypothetical protein W909_13050 [Dickeya zeae EC1]
MSWLDAAPKPPGSKAAHRRPLRATTPFETPFFAYFFCCPFRPAKKWENAFKAGGRATLPALGRRLSRDGVRGTPPTKTGAWARLFARWGGKFFAAPPRPAKAAWARLFAGEARCLKYFRAVIRENIPVRCLIFTARYFSCLNSRKMGGP